MDWKALVMMAWSMGIKKALEELAKKTDNNWDDAAVDMVDQVLKKVLK